MLEKVIRIRNIGRFKDCAAHGDVTFRKLTLLFAENGQGKTTLCAIFRSLQSGQHEPISERRTLGAIGPTEVEMRLGGSSFRFTDGAWSAPYPDIAVFDSAFVHSNVYAGDYVDHEHKKNLYRVIVGEQGVDLAREVEKLDGQIRQANRSISVAEAAASRTLPRGEALDAYLHWSPIDDVDARILRAEAALSRRHRALERAVEIQGRASLAKLDLPPFPGDVVSVLGRQLEDVVADAEARVRKQIARHDMGTEGEAWLARGLSYVEGEKCPFCSASVVGSDLISAYRSHFNAAYNDLKREVAGLRDLIRSRIGETALSTVQRALSSNAALVEFWKQFTDISLPDIDFGAVQERYGAVADAAYSRVAAKEQAPVEGLQPDASLRRALRNLEDLKPSVHAYNTAVDAANDLIVNQKAAVEQAGDVATLETELTGLRSNKQRFEEGVERACQAYRDAVSTKKVLEGEKEAARAQLDRYCEQILQSYESAINHFLDQFNAGFRIVNSRHLYTGGTPSSHYQIMINDTAVALGDVRTQAGTHCFKTTLSSGDRSALALAFFLAAAHQDDQLGLRIVVLDDPFTSLDRYRRTCTQQLIRQLGGLAMQVVVLSHDPSFLNGIWAGYHTGDIKALQLCRVGENTMIGEWDIEAELLSTYLLDHSRLLGFYRDRTGDPIEVARSIRPFIEGLLRAHFPGRFDPNEWFGDFISKIRAADAADGLIHAQADLPELEAINEYSKKYHHDQNRNADSERVSPDELHGFVKRTLRLAGGPS